MKIGIITHHYVKNFGAYMQVIALISLIKYISHDINIEIIDYRVKVHESANSIHFFGFKPQRGDSLFGFVQKIRLFFTHIRFENSLPRSKRVKNAKEINLLNYDLIIVGSDEVWNFNDIAYSPIKFGINICSPHITYAASAGGSTAKDKDIPEVVKLGIKSFQKIAVRDEKTEELVIALTGCKVVRTLDPVYLYDYELPVRDTIRVWATKKPYVLIYDCRLVDKQIYDILEYAEINDYNILGAGEYRKWYTTVDTVNITPYEWAYLFKNATVVVTGTFHGTSFSLKYNRQFVSYLTEQNRINKVESLLAEFGLENRIIDTTGNIIEVLNRPIEYEHINMVIEKRKKESLDYINECIYEVRENYNENSL